MKHFIKTYAWPVLVIGLAFMAGEALSHLSAALPAGLYLGTVFYAPANTGEALSTMAPDAVRKLWQSGVDVFEQSEDFFAPMEGGPNAIIETKTDTSKGRGMTMEFTVMSGFYKEPHRGSALFETSDDFEKIRIATNELAVDFLRHGVRFDERMEEVIGMRGEIVSGLNEETGKWLGRLKSEQLFLMFRERLPAVNKVYASAKTLDTLVSTDTLDYDEILGLGAVSKRLGGMPGQTARSKNGQPIFKNVVVATSDALFSLDQDSAFRSILATTRSEEDARTIFDGGYTNIKGHVIKEYSPIDHDGVGAIGSPLNPKAVLGVAITAGTATFDIKGGGDATAAAETDILFFKYFPNYAYTFLVTDALTQDSDTHYLMIINPPNAATDPNKWGMYAYTTGNNGNKITVTGRLGGSIGGLRNTTLGSVTWNSSASLGAAGNTDVHPIGSTILPCNAKGQIIGWSLFLCRQAARRGYGKYRNRYTTQDHEGGFVMDRFVTSVFGQAPRRDRLQRVPGAFCLVHALKYAGVPTPTIT
jgi:hypothetical protein